MSPFALECSIEKKKIMKQDVCNELTEKADKVLCDPSANGHQEVYMQRENVTVKILDTSITFHYLLFSQCTPYCMRTSFPTRALTEENAHLMCNLSSTWVLGLYSMHSETRKYSTNIHY